MMCILRDDQCCTCTYYCLRALKCFPVRSTLFRRHPWPYYHDPSESMVSLYAIFADLALISARFAARLVQARALAALESLAAKALAKWEANPCHGGLGAGAITSARMECFTAFALRPAGEPPRQTRCRCFVNSDRPLVLPVC